MKRIVLLIILLITSAQTIHSQAVVLDANGVTVKWTGTTVPSPYFVQADPRGTGIEWFAIVDNTTKGYISAYARNLASGINYFTPPGGSTPIPFNNIVTTLVNDLSYIFNIGSVNTFNQPIGSWDVSNVTNMSGMFSMAKFFNKPIGFWNVSNVTNMKQMFCGALLFNQPIGSWNVSNVTNMSQMFAPISPGDGSNTVFNQPIGSWNVSNVTDMSRMFQGDYEFNQPIGSWDVSNVTNMSGMFNGAFAFNQPIGSWNVSNVTNMDGMFSAAKVFNQPIGNWNVSSVTRMSGMFNGAYLFDQPIGSWNVSNVIGINLMFNNAYDFNQPIGSWNVSNVITMSGMFWDATSFDQNIGAWNVSNVTNMNSMFTGAQLSSANYDALLMGWSTISPNEMPLKPNVNFSGGDSIYCNGAAARASIISTYGWTITDGGQDPNCILDTNEFETSDFKLYPNPVVSVLNIKTDNHLINQPYTIIDGLGRVVLNGKFNDVDTIINVDQLSKGIYYLKIAGNNVNKFIKE